MLVSVYVFAGDAILNQIPHPVQKYFYQVKFW